MENYDIAVIGCGFIGSSLARHLKKRYSVATFDINPQADGVKGLGIQHKICDIRNYEHLKKELGNPKVVIHTAIIQIPAINEKKELAYDINVIGTQNICRIVMENPSIKGMILTGSWHVFGEHGASGRIDESFGYRPDKVEDRAKLYAVSKVLQECIVRFYDSMDENKTYGVIRMGTVLGDGMPEKTAANIFIDKGLKGEALTPYDNSMYRPMFYVSLNDLCRGFEAFFEKIMTGKKTAGTNHVVNFVYPEPMTIIEFADIVKSSIIRNSGGKINPSVTVVKSGLPSLFSENDKKNISFDIKKLNDFLNIKNLTDPKDIIDSIVKERMNRMSV